MPNVISPWVYRGDDGRDYITGIDSEVAAQLDGAGPAKLIGGRLATVADAFPPLPSSVKPRRVYCKNAAGVGRTVVAMEPTAGILTTGTTVNLEDSDGTVSAFTVRRVHAENFGRSRV